MTPHEEKVRAEEANQLLRHPMMIEALREIEGRLIEQLALVDITPERVARLQAILAAKRVFERYLREVIQSGQFVLEDERRKANALQNITQFFQVKR